MYELKPLEKISIEEMTARADVGRSTYFRYFKNKEEVLSFKIVCLWKRFDAQHHVGEHTASDEAAAARMFFEFCLSMREVSDLLYAIKAAFLTPICKFFARMRTVRTRWNTTAAT